MPSTAYCTYGIGTEVLAGWAEVGGRAKNLARAKGMAVNGDRWGRMGEDGEMWENVDRDGEMYLAPNFHLFQIFIFFIFPSLTPSRTYICTYSAKSNFYSCQVAAHVKFSRAAALFFLLFPLHTYTPMHKSALTMRATTLSQNLKILQFHTIIYIQDEGRTKEKLERNQAL